jgi:hypothetical protein
MGTAQKGHVMGGKKFKSAMRDLGRELFGPRGFGDAERSGACWLGFRRVLGHVAATNSPRVSKHAPICARR